MKNKFLIIILLAICAGLSYQMFNTKSIVKKGITKIYDEYLSQPDIVLKSKRAFPLRETLRELIIDSITIQKQDPKMELRIASPMMNADTLIKGRVHEVYWDTIPRQKVIIFENMLR